MSDDFATARHPDETIPEPFLAWLTEEERETITFAHNIGDPAAGTLEGLLLEIAMTRACLASALEASTGKSGELQEVLFVVRGCFPKVTRAR